MLYKNLEQNATPSEMISDLICCAAQLNQREF